MRTPEYIAMDVETGGIGEDKCLLTAYIGALDENFEVIDELDLKVKPNDGIYVLTAEALEINKIDLIAHDKVAITYEKAATLIYDFLNKTSQGGKIKLVPVGHNVAFDVQFVCNKTLSKKSWDKFVSYRVMDTGGTGLFLIKKGKLPKTLSASLGSLAKHFDLAFDAHTAKGDALVSAQIMKRMLEL